MTLQLLSCTICPKLPVFSDTSHLLTHVGSKGHLSHLHKLQIRSHQEVSAGLQLAAYNQWYQDHGLGQLLSERMLFKETKQASRRANAAARGGIIQQREAKGLVVQVQESPNKKPTRRQRKVQRKSNKSRRARGDNDSDSDQDFTPARRPKRKQPRTRPASPVKRILASDPPLSSEADFPTELDPDHLATPEHAKLKGTIWPGMALF
ncbi:hypothetical protein LTR84_003388 [Exophiala bonariae]|uniref:U1-type domain-containing protein n=1 Tax=Exophiala bonariae TaxID=1690606 RepID=A0AAV9NAU9_9EURO|nr:hypothetical protein LTR84_003388 [Exophiala bonariae]